MALELPRQQILDNVSETILNDLYIHSRGCYEEIKCEYENVKWRYDMQIILHTICVGVNEYNSSPSFMSGEMAILNKHMEYHENIYRKCKNLLHKIQNKEECIGINNEIMIKLALGEIELMALSMKDKVMFECASVFLLNFMTDICSPYLNYEWILKKKYPMIE